MNLNMKIDTTKIKEFMATKKGKIIVAGGLILVALLIIGGILYIFLFKPAEPSIQVVTPPSQPQPAPAPSEEDEEEILLPEIAIGEEVITLYIFRNPFEPPAMYATAEETPTPGEEEALPLSLDDIYTEDGVEYAVIRYGDNVYTVTEGERVGDSPYQVQAIGTNYVDLLRGDGEVIRLYLGEVLVK